MWRVQPRFDRGELGARFLIVRARGMPVALPIAGYEQSSTERAIGSYTSQAYFSGQTTMWFVQAIR